MKYIKIELQNGKLVETSCKEIDQTTLTSDCWLIQFNGLQACDNCEFLNTDECGGKELRKNLLKEKEAYE